jgi:hypothetical protein
MGKHLITVGILLLALILYTLGAILPASILILLGIVAELTFWFRVFGRFRKKRT